MRRLCRLAPAFSAPPPDPPDAVRAPSVRCRCLFVGTPVTGRSCAVYGQASRSGGRAPHGAGRAIFRIPSCLKPFPCSFRCATSSALLRGGRWSPRCWADSPLGVLDIFDFGRDTSCASYEIVYVTRDVPRSVFFASATPVPLRRSGRLAPFGKPGRVVCDTRTPRPIGREGNHFLRSPAKPACITASPAGTGPASPAMRAGVAEAGRDECRHRFGGWGRRHGDFLPDVGWFANGFLERSPVATHPAASSDGSGNADEPRPSDVAPWGKTGFGCAAFIAGSAGLGTIGRYQHFGAKPADTGW